MKKTPEEKTSSRTKRGELEDKGHKLNQPIKVGETAYSCLIE